GPTVGRRGVPEARPNPLANPRDSAFVKVLVVGGGGREHAIVKALQRSGPELYAVMGNPNPGIRRAAKEVLIHDITDVPTVVAWAKARGADLAVIGPEAPLAAGIVDALEAAGIPAVGPDREAA